MDLVARQDYPLQIDCVWVASDRDGHVAAFVTAGVGPIPELVLNNSEPLLVRQTEEAMLKLPKVSLCRQFVAVPRPESFIALAERGFFVYDWSDVHRTAGSLIGAYERMARPESPISLCELPEPLKSYAASIECGAGAFADSESFKVTDYLECRSATDRR